MITRQKFEKYVEIQRSGVTNMFNITRVTDLSNGVLSREDCLDIMENYSDYETKLADAEADEFIAKEEQ